MKKILLLLVAGAALVVAHGEEVRDGILLQTKSTTMAFRQEGGRWLVSHYGEKIPTLRDVQTLAWRPRYLGENHLGYRLPVTYATYGDTGVTAGLNKHGGLAVQHADGTLSTYLRAVKAETVADAPGTTHLVLTLKDEVYPFYVTQHFRAIESCDVVETWVEIKNDEPGAVRLTRMASFALGFPTLGDEFHVQHQPGQWGGESQLVETTLERGETVDFGSRGGVRDAWGNNASVMLSIGGKATETTGRVFGGVLCWSGMWGITVYRDQVDGIEICAGADTSAGAYVLDAGRSIKLPKFAFTYSAAGKGQISRNVHKWAREWQLPNGKALRPILLNSWEGAYFTFTEQTLHDMMDGVKTMGGELFVLDDGWFGRGKYARDEKNQATVGLGDWTINPAKLPNGLVGLSHAAKQRGLDFGFWVEPEMVCRRSELFEAHPDWVIGERTRKTNFGRAKSQTVLDYANPAVRENIYNQLNALYKDVPLLRYVKWDANVDMMNVGSPYLDAAHQANFAFDYTMGVYDLLARLRTAYPNVDIQACASGGGRCDYGFLKYADEFWTSDDTDARERVFIQWGASQFYPACTMAAHVTAVPNHQTGRVLPLKYRFDVAMSGRMGFELHPKDLSADDLAFAQQAVTDYKRIRPTVQQGDLYRLVSPYDGNYASLMYVNEAKTHAVVFVWGLVRSVSRDYPSPIRLQGLDPAKAYRVKEINRVPKARTHIPMNDKVAGGAALQAMGLQVALRSDYDSAVLELTAE